MAKPVTSDDEIRNVAIIATGSEQMGRTIANCFKRTGANGATMVEDGQTLTDEIEFTEGMEIERGYISPYFVRRLTPIPIPNPNPHPKPDPDQVKNQETQTCELESPRVLVTDRNIGNMNQPEPEPKPKPKPKPKPEPQPYPYP